jgi:butyrate kinase
MVTRITTTSTKYAENTRKLAVQEGSKRIGLKTISNNQSDLIQFDLVSEQSSLRQMLNNSENTIKRRKRVPQVSDSSDLYPLYHDSDKK